MNRKYTDEFKRQAVELADSLGSTLEAARQLGASDSCIHAWRHKFSGSEVKGGTATISSAEAEELKRLKKENAELKKVNHILKAAAAFFSQDHLK